MRRVTLRFTFLRLKLRSLTDGDTKRCSLVIKKSESSRHILGISPFLFRISSRHRRPNHLHCFKALYRFSRSAGFAPDCFFLPSRSSSLKIPSDAARRMESSNGRRCTNTAQGSGTWGGWLRRNPPRCRHVVT